MGLFSRFSSHERAAVLTATPADLSRIGLAAFGGQDPHPPGMSAIPIGELDGYVMAAMASMGHPSPGSPEWAPLHRRFLDELTAAAEAAGDWGFVGAFCIATNFVASSDHEDPQFLAIVDRALIVLRDDGVSYPSVPPFALELYQRVHGFEGARPAGWPSALKDVAVSDPGRGPETVDLEDGESRRLAQPDPGEQSRVIYAERRDDGAIVAVIDGIDMSDGVRKRWEWLGLSAPDYEAFLRELGDRLVTPSYWAHPDLDPYFPCRDRSRDEMRIEARTASR